MKILATLSLMFCSLLVQAQDTLPPPITERETSYENHELLVLALVGLVILFTVYFLWRRRRR